MSKLLHLQQNFSKTLAFFILLADLKGYKVTFGDAYRDPRVFGEVGENKGTYSHPRSLHKQRLAVDLNIFKNGKYLTSVKDIEPIGTLWEQLGGSWGGRFNDPQHFSFAYGGMK